MDKKEGMKAYNGFLPVSLQFANVFGSNPQALPVPGDKPVLGVKPP